jgi:integrase
MPDEQMPTNKDSSILRIIDGLNRNKKIKVRFKPTDQKGYSLYLDLWHQGTRQYEFLRLYLHGNSDALERDKETIKIACMARDQKEKLLEEKQPGFGLNTKKNRKNFIDYFSELTKKEKHHNWRSCLKHLVDFAGNSLPFKQLNRKFCEEFKEYLLSKVEKNTASCYLKKFKTALNIASKERLLIENPALGINIKTNEGRREFLTFEELQIAMKTPAMDSDIINAFIFSCFTGIKYSRVKNLTFGQIEENYLKIRRKGATEEEKLKLHSKAQSIINEQQEKAMKREDNLIFSLPQASGPVNETIKDWMKKAKIDKNITFQCARHTFATMCLAFDADIYSVARMLGHRDLKSTEVYLKLIDKKKEDAIDRLPSYDMIFQKFIRRDPNQIELEFEESAIKVKTS